MSFAYLELFFKFVDKLGLVSVLVLAITGLSKRFRFWVPTWIHDQQCAMWQKLYEDKNAQCEEWKKLALGSMHLTREAVKVTEAVASVTTEAKK